MQKKLNVLDLYVAPSLSKVLESSRVFHEKKRITSHHVLQLRGSKWVGAMYPGSRRERPRLDLNEVGWGWSGKVRKGQEK